jgi:predicted RecB family nuclease
MKLTAQDFYALFAPSECGLRVYLRAKGEPEAEPSEFEEVLRRLGQCHEAKHLATFKKVVNFGDIPFEERATATMAHVRAGAAVLYQPALKCLTTLDGVPFEVVGEPDFLIRENDDYVIRDVKMVRRVDEESHPEVMLQLQYYGWLYTQVFGSAPLRLEVFNGQSAVVTVPEDAESVLGHLRRVLKLKLLDKAPYQPVGWSKCTGCGFHDPCWTEAKAKKDVALVLGVDQGLAMKLHEEGARLQGLQNGITFAAFNIAQFFHPFKLIIDQRLQRPHVKRLD